MFYLHGYKGEVWKEFYTGLLTNLRMLAELPSVRCLNFGAMFIGGGSPNCFSADELRELMTVIRSLFACDDNFEATIEWYPSDLDKEKLKCAHDVGFDRISFGVQTFSERLATSIRQRHTPTDSDRIIKTAQDIGFPNVNIDIISSLPSQKWEEMENDI
ncbi:MAG: radical SAM protein, partial [Nocardioidaceae bacterium]|nr:radical SAM protein [Nocardioidaceae bacterium]